MKFTCEKAVILKELVVAQDIISSRNALSILSNVLLIAQDGSLTIKATDLKVGFETRIPVDIQEPGSTTVFSDKFLSIVRSLPEGEVEFEQNDNKLFIRPRFKKIDFQLKSIASDKFPELQTTDEHAYFAIPQSDFIEMISETIFAISDDETRYFMNGVYMEKKDNGILMVATDGRRLSLMQQSFESEIADFPSVIIPPKILNLVKKLASGEGEIRIAVSEKNLFVEFENQKISSNLIEGQFPNYSRVIPETQEYTLRISKEVLVEALKRVSLLVEQKSRRIYLIMSEGNLTLQSEESEIGVAKEEVPCNYTGPDTMIALNYTYLNDPLRVIGDEAVQIDFSEPNKAITLRAQNRDEYFHIIMPMQLD